MSALINIWSHGLAAALFAALALWGLRDAARQPAQRLLAAAFAVTACWAWLSAVTPGDTMTAYAESARNLLWISLLYNLSSDAGERDHGIKLVYGAVAAVIGLKVIGGTLELFAPSAALAQTALILRVTAAAGALVLVHNVYGQAAPASRSNIRFAMLGLAAMWIYDLNLYTLLYLGSESARQLMEWRGLAVSLSAPLFALALRNDSGWRIRLSRAATFQSLSLLALCAYFALMAILATALRGVKSDWSTGLMIAVLAAMTVSAMVLLPSARARSWAKVKVAKHLFEHRYDYRSEWLRFTETLGRAGVDAAPLGQRIIKAFADILDSPGGLLLTCEEGIAEAAHLNWPGASLPTLAGADVAAFWNALETSGRMVEFDSIRHGWAKSQDSAVPVPTWLIDEPAAWAAVPLLHQQRLLGVVILAAPEYRRPLDWEDFDLVKTAGNQAASSLAEALGEEALANAQRFEEFNRRFAFILHDIKNLVSQLSLVARNAERHADNPDFRADMIATLQASVGKMNDLLARLAPHSAARVGRVGQQLVRPILEAAIAAKKDQREVQLSGDLGASARIDSAALEQAVGHLLQNAFDASSDTPVALNVDWHGATVAISITDQGVGMDGDFVRNRLFKPFASTKPAGFGIGAFEARSLIIAMGGRLTVDSRPGRGTTFTITLPAPEPTGSPAVEFERKIA